MTYRVYIKKDYKMVVYQVPDKLPLMASWGWLRWVIAAGLCLVVVTKLTPILERYARTNTVAAVNESNIVSTITDTAYVETSTSILPLPPQNNFSLSPTLYIPDTLPVINAEKVVDVEDTFPSPEWKTITVKGGDNLSLIFDRLHLSPQILYQVISLGEKTDILKHLQPGQELRFQITEGQLNELLYDINLTKTLHITKTDNQFYAENIITNPETRVKAASGVIDSSLFLAAQSSGLPDNLTMQLIALYGWDIDFALDIRKGDRFYVIYEEHYKNGVKVEDGPILAAEFVNRENRYRAIHYTHEDGHNDYYADTGHSMRKAFLRTPVNFTRISSGFSLKRKHPVLSTIRAHKGVDYAAPAGTIIKATGDGIVTFVGRKGGYGKVVILRHGEKYTTLYGHMSRFKRSIKKGTRVKQGQTIGYIGQTGLATGPHLHYEFRIHGVHHNPLTVKLPKAQRIPESLMTNFKTQTAPLLAQLDVATGQGNNLFAAKNEPAIVALNNDAEEIKTSP